jgi:hypothetical protein
VCHFRNAQSEKLRFFWLLNKIKKWTVKTRGTSLQSPAGRRNGGAFMQKHFSMLLAAATIGLVVSQASAADLPRKAPPYMPPPVPALTWTGCYFGGNIGGAWALSK